MSVLLALAAAGCYGVSDFVGGLAARRTAAWPVAFAAAVGSLFGALVLALSLPGDPTTAHLAWGALAGVGSGAGTAFLYRGFAAGRMGVVAPVSAVGAALLPVAVGVLTGERPSHLVWVGILAALPGIWYVAREPTADPAATGSGSDTGLGAGLVDGLLAGFGFGALFVGLGQVPDGAGYWPLALAQLVSMASIVAMAVAFGVSWIPRHASDAWGAVGGLLASAAVLLFLLASQSDLLTVAAVLTSLYPAVTVVLAALVLREHVYRSQLLGLALCAAAVALVAAG